MNAPHTTNTELAPYADQGASSSMAMLSDDAMMNRMMKFAEVMATGKATIPAELRNVGDCLAITMQAMNWKMNPFSVAQKTFFIGGKIGYEAQLVAAAINNSGAVLGAFQFEWYGPWEKVIGKFEIKTSKKDDKIVEYRVPGWKLSDEGGIGIKCWATLKGEVEPRVLDLLLAQARTRNSTLWADDPRQQLAYLAQKRWARLYAPGVILGVYTADELEQIPAEKEINPRPVRQTGTQAGEAARTAPVVDSEERKKLISGLEDTAINAGIEAYAEQWKNLKAEQRKMVGAEEHERLKKLALTPVADIKPVVGDVIDAETGEVSHG